MILVTGAAINPKDPGKEVTVEPPPETELAAEEEPKPPPGIPIPVRIWTDKEGKTVKAEARFNIENRGFSLLVRGKWIPFPFADLSESDRHELIKVIEVVEP